MAFVFQSQYEPEVVEQVRTFCATLSEKDRRRYVAVEARRVGHGGIEYMAEVFGCSQRTIERGLADLDNLPHDPAAGRVRRPGAGRKKKLSPSQNSHRI
jgi:hypothetical protein